MNKGFVTDERLSGLLSGNLPLSGLKRESTAELAGKGHFPVEDKGLTGTELEFVHDILAHPDDGVDARYRRLGLSTEGGNKLKNELVERGILEAELVPVGKTRRLLLRVAPIAKSTLGLTSEAFERGSLTHEYWKRFYARLFEEHGYRVRLEAPRRGGFVDVLAEKASESVAIEIETGKSDCVENVRKDLLTGFTRVLVVPVHDAAFSKIEKELAQAGLILPQRIDVALAGRGLPPTVST